LHSRFHFDLENKREAIRDEEGVLAIDLAFALEQVVAGVEEMRASGELEGAGRGWFLVVRDAEGIVRKRVPV